jgi:hypothetical protein
MKFSRKFDRLFFLCLVPLVKAYMIFETTCSTPNPQSEFMFVSSPNFRGTLDILWSSLFTIIACTWTLQHPNVPEQRNGRDPGRLGDLKWKLKGLYKSALRMFCTVIAPEMMIGAACGEMMSARRELEKMKAYAGDDPIAWTLSHSYYANMGGFVIRSKPAEGNSYNNPYHLIAEDIYQLRRKGYLQALPNITVEEIEDLSKGDALVKVIAVGQILWTVLQILVRAVQRLPVSPLEVAVVAFAVCAVIIYSLYWNKPQQVYATFTVLDYLDKEIPQDVLSTIKEGAATFSILKKMFFISENSRLPGSTVSIGSLPQFSDSEISLGLLATVVGATVFGVIHIIAWNFTFPSTFELILWRCASVYSAAYPLFSLLLRFACATISVKLDIAISTMDSVFLSTNLPSACLYVVARLIILAEIFRTLCFLPAGSYVSTWASNIPHVA